MPTAQLYCVDGTNLVRGVEPQDEDEEAGRLVAILSRLCAEAGSRLEVELFFDGPGWACRPQAANLRVRASHEEAADDLILDRVRARTFSGGGVTVITGDGDLGRAAQEEGAVWLRVGPGGDYDGILRRIEARFLR